jgi:SNF2 family DNA or RNA helicase
MVTKLILKDGICVLVILKGLRDRMLDDKFNVEEYLDYLKSLTPPQDYTPKTTFDPHQLDWFLKMLNRDKVILGDSMGLGKTKEYLDVCEYRKQTRGYEKVLFICKSKHKENMALEIETHTNSAYLIVDGPEKKRIQTLRDFYHDAEVYYLIIGYEMAAHHNKHLKSLARNMGFDAVVLDEFNKIKNWGNNQKRKEGSPPHITVRVTKLVEVVNPELLILGSGTPMTKGPTDLYAPLRLVGAESRAYTTFKKQFCITDHWGVVRGSKNEDILSKTLAKWMIRRPKDILGLPEKRVRPIPLQMTSDQIKLYEAAVKGIKADLRGTKVYGAAQLALLTRLRQITTNPRLVDADITGIKEQAILEDVEDILESGEKLVIYSIYRQQTLILKELLKKYNPAYIDGYSKKPLDEVLRLQNDPNTRILIGSLHSAKESYTMTAANYGIFIDLSWTTTDNEQAADRLHRRGQTGIVHIKHYYCKGTIDERVLEILQKDSELIEEVVDGATKRTMRKDVFDYLLGG